ncbi:hypothetical protein E2C01_058495 [Portunus trituberculatus]|uniref:Uncharacterized protein n=1 Tax=Portunus trituberculatus TaxID=210409 RepID=A0A5B7GVQ7_PORTR|nr:hypothetical protein [Portunus trituberculatus]
MDRGSVSRVSSHGRDELVVKQVRATVSVGVTSEDVLGGARSSQITPEIRSSTGSSLYRSSLSACCQRLCCQRLSADVL